MKLITKLWISDILTEKITLGTMTFGQQNTEKEAHEILSYAFENGINTLDTAEVYPIPMKKETQGLTDKYIGNWLKSQSRHQVMRRPDRYVALFGEFFYDPSKWRQSVPFLEQLRAFDELIHEGKVRYIGVSNETSYGVMEFINAAKTEGLPKIVSIQNSYSLLVRCKFEGKCMLIDTDGVIFLWGGVVYLNWAIARVRRAIGRGVIDGDRMGSCEEDSHSVEEPRRMSMSCSYIGDEREGVYLQLRMLLSTVYLVRRKQHKYMDSGKETWDQSPDEHTWVFVRDRPFMTSTIIGATSVEQLKEDIDAFLTTERPLSPGVMADIEIIFKRYKDPAIL
ncbi:NAD(P)-linked oxidoreductase superfamily protein [Tanacetum coccineum]